MMHAFADLPIRRKLSLAFTLTSLVVLVLASGAFFLYEYGAFRRELVESIGTTARITADNSTAAVAFNDTASAAQILQALHSESEVLAAALFGLNGELIASYQSSEDLPPPTLADLPEGARFEGDRLICIQPVVEGDRRLGTLQVVATLSHLYSRLTAYGLVVTGVAAAAAFVGWLVRAILQRRIEQPILELAETARAITRQHDFSRRARVQGNDELGELARAFNDMLARIEEGMASQQRAAEEIRTLNTQLEQRVLERTAQLQEANRELESFSYSVSHDLRAPLRHIQGYADMLVRATNGSLPDKALRYLKVITDASSEMGQLIDDLLAFSRMGRAELRTEVVDLGVLIEDVRRGLEMQARERNVIWRIDPLPRVHADPAMLKLAFANLIGNALKFTRTRDPAEIRIGCSGSEDDHAVIFVRDNGVGFDMAYVDKLFGVFQRLHRVEDFEGTGIGLANVRRIVSRHGGRVWAEGRPDAGATFFLTLRTVRAHEATTLPPQ